MEHRGEPDPDRLPAGSTSHEDRDPSRQQYRTLLDINNAIISNLTQDALFHAITEALHRVVSFDRALLYVAEGDVLRTVALEGRDLAGHSHRPHREVSPQGTAVGWAFEHRRPRLSHDLAVEARLPGDEILFSGGVRSYLIVPLITRDRAIGAVLLASFQPGRYAPADVPFLEGVARQIALAVENMRAYEEIARLRARLEEENRYLQEEIKTEHNFEEITGQSPPMRQVFKMIQAAAPTDTTVLVTGETGTGKELVARALHNLSTRRHQPLVKVNCAALPAGLVESELFGHEKGAFTGALARRIGRFELAHGGTLFLDEIGDLPPELQPKLLRVLQEGEFERVGGAQTMRVDVRVIAATNRDLEQAIHAGRFRADLYYRLSVLPLRLPPLRERIPDVSLLVDYFLQKYAARLGKRVPTVPATLARQLEAYPWPGNVRELENVVERGLVLSEGPHLTLEGWFPTVSIDAEARTRTLDDVQREYILETLQRANWRVSGKQGAAKLLGIKPTTLESRMKKLGISRTG